MELKHLRELDGVRAIAALMVMFFHFFQNVQSDATVLLSIKKFSIFGQTGVSLFFVLSGFLITRILMNTKNSESYFLNFYMRRSLRIFPLYFFFLLLYYFILPWLEHKPIASFDRQIYFWTYLQNLAVTFKWDFAGPGHFWSLAVEEHFYLFWPFLIYFLTERGIKAAIAFLILTACIVRFLLLNNGYEVFYFTFSRMDELAVGALLAVLEREGKLRNGNAKKFALLFAIIILPTIALWTLTTGLALNSIQIFKFLLLSFAYFSVIGFIITANESNWLKKMLQLDFFSYTGKISYGLYVYHPTCFYLINKYTTIDSILISLPVSFAFSYLVSGMSYRFFESKFLLLKNRFEYGKKLILQTSS